MPSHHEKRLLPFTAAQVFAVVADIERYPEFLPWTAAARIRSRVPGPDGGEIVEADLVISFKVFRESFGSRVALFPAENRIETDYIDGPFRHLHSVWAIRDLPQGGSEADFHVDFAFRNAILGRVAGLFFDEAMRRVVRAFEERARRLYGQGAGQDTRS